MKQLTLVFFLSAFFSIMTSAQEYSSSILAGKAPLFTDINPLRLTQVTGLSTNAMGEIVMADKGNHMIRKMDYKNKLTLLAGTGVSGYKDGKDSVAQFSSPKNLVKDKKGNFFLLEEYKSYIRKITTDGTVSTFAGSPENGDGEGSGTVALFGQLASMTIDSLDNLYVIDQSNAKIKKISPLGLVSDFYTFPQDERLGEITYDRQNHTLYLSSQPNNSSGKISSLKIDTKELQAYRYLSDFPNMSFGVTMLFYSEASHAIYVSNYSATYQSKLFGGPLYTQVGPGTFSMIEKSPLGILLGGSGYVYTMTNDNLLNSVDIYLKENNNDFSLFNGPHGPVSDSEGNIFFADRNNNRIMKVSNTGLLSTYAGTGISGFVNGQKDTAAFSHPSWVEFDRNGELLVSDFGNRTVRKISKSGMVTTVESNVKDGLLYSLYGMATDSKNNIYVARYGGGQGIAKIDAQGIVSHYITEAFMQSRGFELAMVIDLAIDQEDNLYIADFGYGRIYKVSPDLNKITKIGDYLGTSADGPINTATFKSLQSIALDKEGNIFVQDAHIIRKISNGNVSTITGYTYGNTPGYAEGTGSLIKLNSGWGIAVTPTGKIIVADTENNLLRQLDQTLTTLIELQEDETKSGIKIFPNPSHGYFQVESMKAGLYQIFNSMGTMIISGQVEELKGISIDGSQFAPGLYTIVLKSDKAIKTKQFVVE